MVEDPFAHEKKRLLSKQPKEFVYTVNHLLLQRDPKLTKLVRGHESRLFELALAKTTKPPQTRLDAIKALVTLESDTTRLAPVLDSEKGSELLCAVAVAIAGEGGRVKSEKAVTVLVAKAEKPGDWSPQCDAIRALRYFDDPRVVPALAKAMKHPQQAVRREAMYGLGHQRAEALVPELIAVVKSTTESQHVAAAAAALTAIGTAPALAALEDQKAYTRALNQAKDLVDGRFAVHGLKWFRLARVDDDLIVLATTSEDAEVIEGALSGLVHRQCADKLPAFAKHVLKDEDTRWLARMLVDAMIRLFADRDVDSKVAKELATLLGGATDAVLAEILDDTEQQRYRIDARSPEQQQRIAAWRDAIGGKQARVAKLLSVPE